jgi:RNA polymerase sigma-70 factor (ECF subfamily)
VQVVILLVMLGLLLRPALRLRLLPLWFGGGVFLAGLFVLSQPLTFRDAPSALQALGEAPQPDLRQGDRPRRPSSQGRPHQAERLEIAAAQPAPASVLRDTDGLARVELTVEVGADLGTDPAVVERAHGSRTRSATYGFRPCHSDRRGRRKGSPRLSWRVPCSVTTAEPARGASPFDVHVVPHVDVLYRVALSLTGQPADAEDLVQDTLIRAYRAIDRFDGRHPRAWLLTILRHTHLNRVRVRRPDLVRDGESVELTLEISGPAAASAEDVVVSETFEAVVADALACLPDKHRAVIALVDIDGLTYQEAADALGVPRGTVMSRLHRGRARIRTRLGVAGLVSPGRGVV